MHVPFPTDRPRSRRFLYGVVLVPFLAIFASSLFSNNEFAFRDVSHYYGPYWRYVHQQWSTEGLPWWNSLEENGRPLAADATASVFYPGQLIFFLPIPFSFALKLYIYFHVLLAAVACFLAARSLGRSSESSMLAALAYAFGGSVVFQYCNPIFLVGAAWLPLGFATIHWTVVSGQVRYALALSAVMGMTVLGGNPQSAYLLVLIAVLKVACRSSAADGKGGAARRGTEPDGADGQPLIAWPSRVKLVALFGIATLLGLLLSAVQVWPSIDWARSSERAFYDTPRSLAELAADLTHHESVRVEGLLRPPTPGTHRDNQYNFSIGPWRWTEMFWPNVSGRPFPRNERWLNVVPAEGRYWSPSLYMGLAPVLFGVLAVRLRSPDHTQRWLSWCVVVFGLACLGEYGLVWMIHEVRLWFGMPPTEFWSPVGGVYWLMNVSLPGFVMFRYPAKLWTIVGLALSLLAAGRLDEIQMRSAVRERNGVLVYGALTITLLGIIVYFAPSISGRLMAVQPDLAFGPLDQDAAVRRLRWTFVHGLVIGVAVYACLGKRQQQTATWIVLITAIDLAIANAWLAPTVPTPARAERASPLVAAIQSRRHDDTTVGTYRWQLSGWYPRAWSLESDSRRLEQVVNWDRDTLRPKYNLDDRLAAMNSSTSFASIQHRAMLDLLRWSSRRDPVTFCRLLGLIGVQYVIAPTDVLLTEPFVRLETQDTTTATQSAKLWHNPTMLPRAWIVHRSRMLESPRRLIDLRGDLEEVLLPQDSGMAIDRCAVLEPTAHQAVKRLDAHQEGAAQTPDEFCHVASDRAAKLVIRTHLRQPGFVVIRDSYAPGWKCLVQTGNSTSRPAEVLRANRIMRAVALPAGTHELTMVYRPRPVYLGAGISAMAWLSLMAAWFVAIRGRHS